MKKRRHITHIAMRSIIARAMQKSLQIQGFRTMSSTGTSIVALNESAGRNK
jgi:hypothetical protein